MKRKFIEDPECRVVFTQYASGGVGIDGFQNVCSHAVMLELMAVPGLYDQWISRINRSGQTEPQTVYILTATGTLSVALKRNLLRKEEEANLVVMDKKQLLSNLIGEDQ
jgi:SNF2 family DNA or RNA helicase